MGVSQVTADCSNSFTLWLVHTITKSGLARLVFEEWFLHHHTPQRLSVLDIKKLRGSEITSAEYKHQVLAIGLSTGAVRLYQPASDIQVEIFLNIKFWSLVTSGLTQLFLQVFMAESKEIASVI